MIINMYLQISVCLFVCRMVLDPKSGGSHNDYGSISGEREREHEAGCGGSELNTNNGSGTGTSGGSSVAMTQSDLYQRQPLLPADTSAWASKNGGSMAVTTDLSEDDDDKMNGLERNTINSNGVVRIEVPSPLREEIKFPKEKLKTFIGIVIDF